MTIRTTNRVAGPFAAGATSLPFAFKAFNETDMRVTRSDAAGNTTTLTYGVHYTVTLNTDQEASPGGRINLYAAIPFGYTCSVTTAMPALQTLALTNQGGFFPNAINDAFDKMVILIQQQTGGSGGGGGGGGGGDITNGVNVGTGAGIFSGKSGSSLLFKSLKAGVGVTLVPGADDITINATGGGGGGSSQFLSVKDFGAVGDGTASDATAFANAISAAKAQGKSVLVPDGKYNIQGLSAQSGRVALWGTGRSVLLGTFPYHEPNFKNSASTQIPLNPDDAYFSAVGIAFQSTTSDFALKLSTVYQGGFITTFSLERCKFYGSNGLLCQHMAGFELHGCEFNNVLVGAQFEGCVNGNILQTRFQNQAVAGVRITFNAANSTRRGGENLRFTNCEFDCCSHGLAVAQHQWLVVESCLFDYCALPVYLLGSFFAKIEKSYLGVSNVVRTEFVNIPGAVFPDANGIALYGLNVVELGMPIGVTCSNCEFVNYIAGSNQPVVYMNGYGNSGQPIMAYECTFTECMFYMPELHSAPRILDIAYCRAARVINNRFLSSDRSTTMVDAYSTANCADYYNHSNDFVVCTQSGAVVRSRYEREVGARIDGSDPGPLGIGALWVPNGTGALQVRNPTNTGWNTIGTGGGGSTKVKIVTAGASQTARQALLSPAWPDILNSLLNSSGANVEVINVAKNGWTYYNANTVAMFGSATMRDKIIALAPDILHVHLGFNDALMRVNPRNLAQLQADAQEFYSTIRAALPNCKIFYGSEVSHDIDNAPGAAPSLKNKQVIPQWFQLKSSGILAGAYTQEILEDNVSSTTNANVADWIALTAYIKALPAITATYDVPIWKLARMGLMGYDNIHFTQFGTHMLAGAVRAAYKTNATMAAALPNLSYQDYDSFNDPAWLFALHFSISGGNWIEGVPSRERDHPTHQLGPYRYTPCTTWFMPSKGSLIYNVATVSNAFGDVFHWQLYDVNPNSAISVSVDGGAFTALGVSTDMQGKYSGAGSLTGYAAGTRVFRYKVGNEIHGPITLTVTQGAAAAVPTQVLGMAVTLNAGKSVGTSKTYMPRYRDRGVNQTNIVEYQNGDAINGFLVTGLSGRYVQISCSVVVDNISSTSAQLVLGLDVWSNGGTTFAYGCVLASGYPNLANGALALSFTVDRTCVDNNTVFTPWVLLSTGTGTIIGSTSNGASHFISCRYTG